MFKKWTNKTNLEILEIFRKNIFSQLSLSQIEKSLGLSHHPTYRRIKQLQSEGLIISKGRDYVLDVANPETIEALYILSRMDRFIFMNSYKNDLFKRLGDNFEEDSTIECAIIFGSYARAEQTKSSDLDIFLITSTNKKINLSFEAMYDVKTSIIYSSKKEFISMIKDRKKIIKDLYLEGIMIKGNLYKILSDNYGDW